MKSMTIIPCLALACVSAAAAQTTYPLRVGEPPVERIVLPGKPHLYTVSLAARQVVSGAADQRTADVIVRVLDPTGRQVGYWDVPARGDESFRFNTAVGGEFKIEISAFERDSGAYALRLTRAEPLATDPANRVDQIMSDYDSTTPGGVIAVVQNGKVVFARGYGMGNLEHDAPNMPETPYHMASVSKQFTAFAILLLAQQGKLSLDDDIRKYLPELADFGTPITIRHLIHHTSGLRDQWTLWQLAGGRMDDVIREEDLLSLIRRQRELNFKPGSEHLYSNTGYMLLAEIAARVAREPFGPWMKRNVFDPLGMAHTQIYDDHERLVKGRADSYHKDQHGRWARSVLSYANRGATSLFTTASDLALWLGNFKSAAVGGPGVIEQMKVRGRLNNGDSIPYAAGIAHAKQRGLDMLVHSGGDAGFRTYLSYYPALDAGVIVLGNEAGFNASRTALDVAEAFFGERMSAAPVEPPASAGNNLVRVPPWTPSAKELETYAGVYWSPELETRYTLLVRDGKLIANHRRNGDLTLRPIKPDSFGSSTGYFSRVEFERNAQGRITGFRVSSDRVRRLLMQRLQ